jgi:hypothetical protein
MPANTLSLTTLLLLGLGSISPASSLQKPERRSQIVSRAQLEARVRRVNKASVDTMVRGLESLMLRLVRSEQTKKWRDYERTTRHLLLYGSRVPVDYLTPYHRRLLKLIRKHGCEPFLSFIIDYDIRLTRLGTATALRQVRQLRDVYHCRGKPRPERRVYLRERNRRGFSAYSENVGRIAAKVAFSDAGRDYLVGPAFTAVGLLRLVAVTEACADRETDPRNRVSIQTAARVVTIVTRVEGCAVFLTELDRDPSLRGALGGTAGLAPDLQGLCGDGFGLSSGCLSALSNDLGAEIAQHLEDYVACRNAERTPGQPKPEAIVASVAEGGSDSFNSWDNPSNNSRGSSWTIHEPGGSKTDLEHSREAALDSQGHTIVTDRYSQTTTDANGKQTSVDQETIALDRTTGAITTTSYEYSRDPAGNTTETNSSSFSDASGGASFSSTTSTDANGNTTSTTETTVEYADGSTETWTTSTDANGKTTTSHSTTPATEEAAEEAADRVEEGMADHCSKLLADDPRAANAGRPIDPLARYILPNPDAVSAAGDFGACLPNSGLGPTKCLSVMYCLEGSVDSLCRCAGTRGTLPAGVRGGACQRITCADGASCDPETGTCRTQGGGLDAAMKWQPGPLPLPVGIRGIRPTVGSDIRTTFLVGELTRLRDLLDEDHSR